MFDTEVKLKHNIIHVKIVMANWWVNASTSESLRQRIPDEQATFFAVDKRKVHFRQNQT